MEPLEHRLAFLRTRLQSAYDGLGQSTGRPYLYVVYPPEADPQVRRFVAELFTVLPSLHPVRIDVLPLTLETLRGEEARIRESILTSRREAAFRRWLAQATAGAKVKVHAELLQSLVEEKQ